MNKGYLLKIIVLLILVSSCSVEKRNYRKGYYIDWVWQKNKNSKAVEQKNKTANQQNNITFTEEEKVNASTQTTPEFFPLKKKTLLIAKDTCGDVMLLKRGEEMKVKVLEIDETKIKYKRCDNLKGPTYEIEKQKVALITFSNGVKEIIEAPTISQQQEYYEPKKTQQTNYTRTTPDIAKYAVILAVIGIFVFPATIVALILANKAEKMILAEPNKYEGMDVVDGAKLICYVTIAIWAMLLFFTLFIMLLLI